MFTTRRQANSYKRIRGKWYDKAHRVVKTQRRRMDWNTGEQKAPETVYILQLVSDRRLF